MSTSPRSACSRLNRTRMMNSRWPARTTYGYDTVTGQIKFVADLSGAHDNVLWGEVHGETSNDDSSREVQTTPDGRYLVFSSGAQLAGDLNKPGHQAVYRYDFESGELTWVSHGATGFTYKGEGLNATVSRLDGGIEGADASVDDSSRAVSG